MLAPFLNHFLKDDAPPLAIAPVTAFETGSQPLAESARVAGGLHRGLRARARQALPSTRRRRSASRHRRGSSFEAYVSDPAKPVPYLPRPIHIGGDEGEESWQTWLVSDQRDAASRTDVLELQQRPCSKEPLKISGEPVANLVASTTGTDGDFVVKLIDVYPDEVGREPKMGGYELMVSADILRGRYRDSFSDPKPIPAGKSQVFRFSLPTANHVFLAGHRIMVQVQSSWFPLYDRNPQTYVENIFFAKPSDYQKSTVKVYDGGPFASFVELPVVKSESGPAH